MIRSTPTATLYARPTAFIDAPFGFDGQFERLAGGLQFFGAWEIIATDGGRRIGATLVPVDRVDEALAAITPQQEIRLRTMMTAATAPRGAMQFGSRTIRFDQPNVMAILNITPDSFSDGGKFLDKPGAALDHAHAMLSVGAALP